MNDNWNGIGRGRGYEVEGLDIGRVCSYKRDRDRDSAIRCLISYCVSVIVVAWLVLVAWLGRV